LTTALFQFGMQTPSARKMHDKIADETSQPGHCSDNSLAVTLAPDTHVSTLWDLTFKQQRVRCVVYRRGNGMELRLESPTGVILREPFELEPRALAKTKALREALKRRGWREEENPKSQIPKPNSQEIGDSDS